MVAEWDEIKNDCKFDLGNEKLVSGTKIIIDESVTYIGYIFDNAENLKEIYIGKNASNFIPLAFSDYTSLTSIAVHDENEHFTSVDGVIYSKDMTVLCSYPIAKCGSDFTIPDSVSYISPSAFYGCLYIENIVIPKSVEKFGNGCLSKCSSLKNLYYLGSKEDWKNIHPSGNWTPNNAIIHFDGAEFIMTHAFAGFFGSSGSSAFVCFMVDNGDVYFNYNKYDLVLCEADFNLQYSEFTYSNISNSYGNSPEKLAVLDMLENCDKLYVFEGTTSSGAWDRRIVCYMDGMMFIMDSLGSDEETGTERIYSIVYSIVDWENWNEKNEL